MEEEQETWTPGSGQHLPGRGSRNLVLGKGGTGEDPGTGDSQSQGPGAGMSLWGSEREASPPGWWLSDPGWRSWSLPAVGL